MFRFIHSADWQLGARFSQFGGKGARLREARLETLDRTLQLAEKHAADAFLVAGDLFEDNQVEDALVERVVSLFGAHPQLPVYILPGNHDAASGPDSVWHRKAFLNAPANVHVLLEAGVTDLGANTFLLASPLHQKLSPTDPSLKLVDLAAGLPVDAIKLGLTHGALAIEAKHQPNDFPIALNAASRAGLDYLAIGHWHNWLPDTDGGRIVMPGTPEPDRFINDASGHVALVEIPGAGQAPQVKPLRVATFDWRELVFDFHAAEASRASLQARHPILAQVLADIDRLETFAGGTVATVDSESESKSKIENPKSKISSAQAELSLADAQALLGSAKIDLTQLTPEFFAQLRQTVFQTLQEVSA